MRKVRTREPFRRQGVMRFEIPEDSLAEDHRARLLWQVVETVALSAFTARAKAVEGRAGRPLASIQMQLVLWLYAISVGVGSAREIARLTRTDTAFAWIVADQAVSHDTLSVFRVAHGVALDGLMIDVLGVLLHKGLLSLDLVAQDGTRVRASAAAPSFRRERSLEDCREQAALHVKAVLSEQDDPETTEGEKRARLAAAFDYQKRVEEALAVVKELRNTGKAAPRVMKMADGGFRPGYNVQLATAGSPMGGPRTVVGVRVTNVGSDLGSVTPMLDDIERRTGELPKTLMADANHAKHDCIVECAERGVEALISVPAQRRTPGARPQADQRPAVLAWRERMSTEAAKTTFRARASLCELSNAHLKHHHGMAQVLVRGTTKVTCVALLCALSANLVAHAAAWLG